jgi:hypothetical protein
MLTIVNFVPKVQALDKSAATLAEIRRQLGPVRVLSVISLTETNRIDSIDPLIDLLSEVSDRTVFAGGSEIHRAAYARLVSTGKPTASVDIDDLLGELHGVLSHKAEQTVLISPVGKGAGEIGDFLRCWASEKRAPVLGYFKSLHDEGMGLSTPSSETDRANGMVRHLRKLAGRLRSSSTKARFGELTPSQTDWLMVFNRRHAQTVADKAGDSHLIETGYQLLFPAWRKLVSQSSYCRTYSRGTRLEVVLFTRGETPGRPPEENVVPHANLARLFGDIVAALDDTGRDWHLRIKPHPIQDVAFLRDLIADRANIEIVYEAPALLAATADLAISTYSSTVVDTLAFGVPTIEYFFETPFFQAKHPTGSPFPDLGVKSARTLKEFKSCLIEAIQSTDTDAQKLSFIRTDVNFHFLTIPPAKHAASTL